MDEQILKAIKCNCGDLTGITTDEFYNDYLEFCAMDFVKPRQKAELKQSGKLIKCFAG